MTQPNSTEVAASSAPAEDAPSQNTPPPGKTYSQAELDAFLEERLARAKRQQADETKDLRAKAAEADRLRKERETETEKAIREAREEGRNAALAEARPRLVLAEIRAAAAGRIEASRLDDLVDDIDLSRYLGDDGSVDVERVRRKVDAWAPPAPKAEPSKDEPKTPRRPRPDPSQSAPRPAVAEGSRGLAEAQRRFGDRARTL